MIDVSHTQGSSSCYWGRRR